MARGMNIAMLEGFAADDFVTAAPETPTATPPAWTAPDFTTQALASGPIGSAPAAASGFPKPLLWLGGIGLLIWWMNRSTR